ncbi:unnamed protein product [Boreogadus saida]
MNVEEHLEPEDEVLHLHENSFHLFWLLERLLQPGVEGPPQDYQGAGPPQDYQGAGPPQDYMGAGFTQEQGPQDCGGAGAPQDYQGAGVPQEQGGAGVPQDRGAFQGPQGGPELQGPQEREAFLGLLGHSVLLLSDEFPLFALYMWRIGALLSWS